MTTTASKVGQNLNLDTLRLALAYRARTYTVTAYIAMNRSLPAAPDVITTCESLQAKSDVVECNIDRISLLRPNTLPPKITTSEDATMLLRITLTIVGIVFSEMIATRRKMFMTKKIGSRKRVKKNPKYEKVTK